MERKNTETAADEESTDSTLWGRRPQFETNVKRMQAPDGRILLTEPNKGAAWIECDASDLLDATEHQ